MSARTYECRGSGEIGGPRQDFVGWCLYCKKIQRLRVGSGRLMTHWTANPAHSKNEPKTYCNRCGIPHTSQCKRPADA